MSTRWILIALCAAAISCSKRPATLSIAGATVTLGMSKEEVVPRLSRDFELSQLEQTDVWLVDPKGGKADIFRTVGSLSFKNGRLIGASRSRGKFRDTEALAFANALHEVFSELDRSGEQIVAAKAATRQADYGLGIFRSITLQFTTRTIIIGVTQNKDPSPRILLEEHIGWPKLQTD